MKLVYPAIYEGHGSKKWIKLQDLLDMAKRDFDLEPFDILRDLEEWHKPSGGFLWATDSVMMNSETEGKPDNFDGVFILEKHILHFWTRF